MRTMKADSQEPSLEERMLNNGCQSGNYLMDE